MPTIKTLLTTALATTSILSFGVLGAITQAETFHTQMPSRSNVSHTDALNRLLSSQSVFECRRVRISDALNIVSVSNAKRIWLTSIPSGELDRSQALRRIVAGQDTFSCKVLTLTDQGRIQRR